MYHQIHRCSESKELAFLTAVFYSFSSYFLLVLCIRMAFGEACACVFLPFVFCPFYNILYQPKKHDWLYLAFGMSGLILSHNLTAIFTAGILGIWTILQFRRIANKKVLANIGLAVITTVGLTASYTFAFIEANVVQKYQIPTNNEYQMAEFARHTYELVDFFIPYEIKKGLSVLLHLDWDIERWRPGAVGVFLPAILILTVKTRKYKKNKAITVPFGIAVVLYLSMFVKPFVSLVGQLLSFMQFGWRLLLFCAFAFSVYAAYLLYYFFNKRWQNVYVILAIVIACYTIAPRYVYQMYLDYKGMDYVKTINEEAYEHYIMEYSSNSGDSLYLPQGVSLYLYKERGERVDCNHETVTYSFAREDNKCRLIVSDNTYEDTMFELPLYYYKGYAAVDKNTGEKFKVSPSENKLVMVTLSDGIDKADLEIWYRGTLAQTCGNWISGFTLLALFFYGVCYYKPYRRFKRKEKEY